MFSFLFTVQCAYGQLKNDTDKLSLSSLKKETPVSLQITPELTKTTSEKKPFIKKAILPAALIGLGLFTLREEGFLNKIDMQTDINNQFPDFHTKLDDYTQLVPLALTYGMQWCGNRGKNDFINKTLLLIKSEVITLGLVHFIKRTTKLPRPDTGARTSFPSGHTAQAFVAATFMHKEYGHKSVWYSVIGYSFASATGVLRVLNNRHYVPDVLAGAGMAILITEFVYKTHQFRWGTKSNVAVNILPAVSSDYQGLSLSIRF